MEIEVNNTMVSKEHNSDPVCPTYAVSDEVMRNSNYSVIVKCMVINIIID